MAMLDELQTIRNKDMFMLSQTSKQYEKTINEFPTGL